MRYLSKKPYILKEKIYFIGLLLIICAFRLIKIQYFQPKNAIPVPPIAQEEVENFIAEEIPPEPIPKKTEKSVFAVKEILNDNLEYKAFLTFDDGPSSNTEKILEVLNKYDIKATFFLVGNMAESQRDLVKKIHKSGHSIGNHSYSHNVRYKNFSPEYFVNDIKRNDALLKDILGKDFKTNLVRFPGGSFNLNSYKASLKSSGFEDINWNLSNGDTSAIKVPKSALLNNIYKETEDLNNIKNGHNLVILMHDLSPKDTTVEALPEVIEFLQKRGYKFCAISERN